MLLHVRCDADVLTGDLERARQRGAHVGDTSLGVALSAATIRRLACDAGVIPTVLGGDSQILDVGRMRRTATAAQRSALEHRDGHCVFPGCDRPPGWCQVHHLIPWKTGGSTNLDNLVMLCGTHHHMLHEGRWKLRRDSSGWVAIPPGDRPGSGGANAAGGLGGALPSNVAADTPADGTCSDGDRPLGLAGVDDALARGRPARRVEKPGSPVSGVWVGRSPGVQTQYPDPRATQQAEPQHPDSAPRLGKRTRHSDPASGLSIWTSADSTSEPNSLPSRAFGSTRSHQKTPRPSLSFVSAAVCGC
ncbi:MAG: DUF222 domain-containing protein [Acidimicrobiia bacterium]|nr:DUF222 domain-containing protein [Acidimicrobiia bacterium]